MTTQETTRRDVRQEVTNSIIEHLERGVMPWRKGWGAAKDTALLLPRNGATGHVYRGGNRLYLLTVMREAGYDDPRFFTFKQLQALGAGPEKGSKGYAVEYWDRLPFWRRRDVEVLHGDMRVRVVGADDKTATLATGEQVAVEELSARGPGIKNPLPWHSAQRVLDAVIAKYAVVFNVAQARGLEEYLEANPLENNVAQARGLEEYLEANPLEKPAASALQLDKQLAALVGHMKSTGLTVQFVPGDSACYLPRDDRVVMPAMEQFKSSLEFRSTLLHELIHATGHEKRLNREGIAQFDGFGTERYAREELIAELGSAFAAAETGIERDDANHAAYIDSWLKVLRGKDGKHALFEAARQADKACDYVLEPLRERQQQRQPEPVREAEVEL
ncbi:ArdC family protein [Tepidimonas charontis]|uniref:DNA primase TraC n=1 Tax=Tepidimonas charontis TaxID=2267262 RepID=A0A554X524_9BURK|nr:zincin-like metallopeptidase domain-containing protein [Tepidimonas charontis]TSE30923.1 DNA primase TraC [Tepidimonas charontis]